MPRKLSMMHALNLELGRSFNVVYASLEMARILNHKGIYRDAQTLAAETLVQAEEENYKMWIGDLHLEIGAAMLGQREIAKGELQIRTGIQYFRDLGDYVYLGYSLPVLGICLFAKQDYAGMRAVVKEFLQVINHSYQLLDVVFGFPALSLLQLAEENVEQAITYYAYAALHGYIANSIWFQDLVRQPIEKAAETLLPDGKTAAWDRGLELDPIQEIERLSIELKGQAGKARSG